MPEQVPKPGAVVPPIPPRSHSYYLSHLFSTQKIEHAEYTERNANDLQNGQQSTKIAGAQVSMEKVLNGWDTVKGEGETFNEQL